MTEIRTIIKTDDADLKAYITMCKSQDFYVDKLFYCMDNNNVEGFRFYFQKWHDITGFILNHKYNTVGHCLDDSILEYAYNNCFDLFDIYYERDTL